MTIKQGRSKLKKDNDNYHGAFEGDHFGCFAFLVVGTVAIIAAVLWFGMVTY